LDEDFLQRSARVGSHRDSVQRIARPDRRKTVIYGCNGNGFHDDYARTSTETLRTRRVAGGGTFDAAADTPFSRNLPGAGQEAVPQGYRSHQDDNACNRLLPPAHSDLQCSFIRAAYHILPPIPYVLSTARAGLDHQLYH